ncbi:hypothetical protein BD833_103101 [Blastococcus xanthinilyticus]|uniref:Uncharacterized protein n=1 Tax=Blastococcus xanthinilyticus TaxID=1564164 RepID=A0A5S5CZI0_9ACTN|nr:hypothetical protein BD833_103101 [Blastococcus xanthinilyticus]
MAAAACALAVAVAVAVSGELSAGALLAVGLAGSAVVVLAAARRSGAAAPPVGRRGLPWLAWCAAALGWELVALAGDGQPSLSDLADPLLAHPGVRGAATLGWLAAGAWLIARPRARARP